VSAAAFSIGWRHQAQRDTAAQTALAAATAHVRTLEGRIARLEESLGTARQAEAEAVASSHALTAAAGKVAAEATASGRAASSLSSDAASLTASAARIASELKTLETYLATTPAGQLDPGYVVSQTAYLTRQLDALKIDGGRLGDSVAGFEATARKLAHDAAVLSTRS
jgi:chromosome segregation ATPase